MATARGKKKSASAQAARRRRPRQVVPSQETVESLRTALEELRVAEDELRGQNQELAEARQAIEKEKANYQELFELAPDPYLVTDGLGMVREANRAAESLIHVEQGYLVGKPISLYIHPDHVRDLRLRLPRIPDHAPETWETVLQPRHGGPVDVEITAIASPAAFPGRSTIRWIIRDITERKKAEAVAVLQTTKLQEQADLLNLTRETIIVRDLSNRILFWNLGAQEMYGWTAAEARGQVTHELLQTRFSLSQDAIETALKNESHWEGELTHTRRDGSQLIVLSRQVLQRDTAGVPKGILEINSDITGAKDRELEIYTLNTRLERRVTQRTEELVQANLRVTTVLNSITDSYLAFDHQWRVVDLNPIAEQYLFGRPRDELLGKVFWEEYPESVNSTFYSEFQRAVAGQQPVHFEGFSTIANRWYEAHAYPTPAGLEVYLRDITMRKQEEETHNRLAAIVESSGDAIIGMSLDGYVTSWNPAAERLFGYTAAEVNGRPITLIYPADHHDESDILKRLKAGERIEHFETVRLRKNGERVDVSVSVSPIRDGGGQLIGAAKIERDITAEKRARAAQQFLAQASASLGSSLDYQATLEQIAHLGIPFLADLCLVEVVKQAQNSRQIAVAARDPAKETALRELSARYLGDPNAGTLHRVRSTGQPETRWQMPDEFFDQLADPDLTRLLEALAPHAYMIVPMVVQGRAIGTLSLVLSESARTYNVEDLAVAQTLAERAALAIDNARLYFEAQAAIVARDQFLAVASHEVRTPLTVIQGYTQLWQKLTDDAEETGSDTVQVDRVRMARTLANIEFATTRLTALIGDLLDISRMRDRELHISPETVNLNELVRRVISGMRAHLDHRERSNSIDFRVRLPEETVWGEFDPVRLEQVLGNLIDNAIKYSPSSGRVWVRLAVEPGAWEGTSQAHLVIKDEGIGIPAEEIGRIFQPFIRAGNATERNYPGLGLGLAVSREIVTRHGGRIWVESPGVDQGSTFHLVLPGVSKDSA